MNRKILSIIIIFFILISGTFYYFISSGEKKEMIIEQEEIDLDLKILVSYTSTPPGELPFCGDMLWFELEGDVPEDIEYIWDLGDGTRRSGIFTTHGYDISGHYNVSVKCELNGKMYSDNTIVSVKNQDFGFMFNSSMSQVGLGINKLIWKTDDGTGTGCGAGVTPGITIPFVDVVLTVDHVVGTMNISVWITEYNGTIGNDIMIDSMSGTYQNEVVKYENIFLPSTFEGVEMPYFVSVYHNTIKGVSEDWRGHIFINY